MVLARAAQLASLSHPFWMSHPHQGQQSVATAAATAFAPVPLRKSCSTLNWKKTTSNINTIISTVVTSDIRSPHHPRPALPLCLHFLRDQHPAIRSSLHVTNPHIALPSRKLSYPSTSTRFTTLATPQHSASPTSSQKSPPRRIPHHRPSLRPSNLICSIDTLCARLVYDMRRDHH